ncbi:dymeclin-like [Watersipora subatra]|uniref:dymeclin-like n=1 Tax=Watersipora subatra TaxID=2589382 RepID=UPI00355BA21D
MGTSCSSLQDIGSNEYLKRLCSNEILSENDPFWNALLGFSLVDLDLVVMSSSNSKLLEDAVNSLCKNLSINNAKTGNFHTQVNYFVRRLHELIRYESTDDDENINPFTWQVLNALFIIRNICKYFIQNLSEEVIIQQFQKPGSTGASVDTSITSFIAAMTTGLTKLPIHESTILLHLEIVNTLLTILGMVMYGTDMATNNVFYIEIMEGQSEEAVSAIMQFILAAYAYQDQLPAFVYREDTSASLSSTLWSVMTLGMVRGAHTDTMKVNLALQSALLLLTLTNHPYTGNPYAKVLSSFLDDENKPLVKPESLYASLCKDLHNEHATLLLYKLLHENQVMRAFVLSRTDMEKLAEPLLMVLYQQDDQTSSNHIYLTLITLLMLTEDDGFNKDLFQTRLRAVKWYKEKHLTDVTLGDMFILVAIKVMQYNMSHSKDKYLHTNCLAMLANMSSKFENVHPYACQRLLAFYSALAKRHDKTRERLQLSQLVATNEEERPSPSAHLLTDLQEIQEMIRMVSEVINSCITHTVHTNSHLVHVMLCHRMEFEKLRELEPFKHILQNVHQLLEQFHKKLEDQFGDQPRSVAQVMEVIENGLKTFRRGSFLKFPDLKFKYVEETDSSQFFVPYVWQIVCRKSNLYFKQSKFH